MVVLTQNSLRNVIGGLIRLGEISYRLSVSVLNKRVLASLEEKRSLLQCEIFWLVSAWRLHATYCSPPKCSALVTANCRYGSKGLGGNSVLHTVDSDSRGERDIGQSDRYSATRKQLREREAVRTSRNSQGKAESKQSVVNCERSTLIYTVISYHSIENVGVHLRQTRL